MNKRTKKTIDGYNKIAQEYVAKQELLFPDIDARKFISLIKRGAKILDVGCAGGRDVHRFSEMGYSVTGIDLSENLLTIARQKYPQCDFRQEDMTQTSFPDNTFDAIWASGVLHHLDKSDMPKTLKEWLRILKKEGIVFISTKFGNGDVGITEALSSGQERQFTLLADTKLHGMLQQAGFTKIELSIYNEKDRRENGRDLLWITAFYRKA